GSGTFLVRGGSTIINQETWNLDISGGTYIQNSGTTTIFPSNSFGNGTGNFNANSVTISGGTLKGTGTIFCSVSNTGGIVAPGNSPGILTINGDYTQSSSGTLNIEIGGTSAAAPDFDQLHVTGSATLGGTLNVSQINGFLPAAGQSFQILTFASRAGDFATYND